MTNPKVSVIVPVYKTERYLKRCIASVTAQTLKEIEIILVDDGSPDGSGALCDLLAAQDARIRVIHKQNEGLGMARNTGLSAASGEYIGFVDSDDYIDENMYEVLYNAAKTHEAQLAVSGLCFVGGNMFAQEDEREEKAYFEKETVFEGTEEIQSLLLGIVGALPHEPDDSRYGMSVCKNLYQRAFLERSGVLFLSERDILSEDALFTVDCLEQMQKAVGVPGAHYCYCRNGESLSKSYNPQRMEKSIVFLKVLEQRIAKTLPKQTYRIYLDRLAQGFGRVLCSQEILHAREEKLSYTQLRRRLKAICTQKEIAGALKTYPWYKLPVKQAVFAFLMKYKLYLLQTWVVALRNQ